MAQYLHPEPKMQFWLIYGKKVTAETGTAQRAMKVNRSEEKLLQTKQCKPVQPVWLGILVGWVGFFVLVFSLLWGGFWGGLFCKGSYGNLNSTCILALTPALNSAMLDAAKTEQVVWVFSEPSVRSLQFLPHVVLLHRLGSPDNPSTHTLTLKLHLNILVLWYCEFHQFHPKAYSEVPSFLLTVG